MLLYAAVRYTDARDEAEERRLTDLLQQKGVRLVDVEGNDNHVDAGHYGARCEVMRIPRMEDGEGSRAEPEVTEEHRQLHRRLRAVSGRDELPVLLVDGRYHGGSHTLQAMQYRCSSTGVNGIGTRVERALSLGLDCLLAGTDDQVGEALLSMLDSVAYTPPAPAEELGSLLLLHAPEGVLCELQPLLLHSGSTRGNTGAGTEEEAIAMELVVEALAVLGRPIQVRRPNIIKPAQPPPHPLDMQRLIRNVNTGKTYVAPDTGVVPDVNEHCRELLDTSGYYQEVHEAVPWDRAGGRALLSPSASKRHDGSVARQALDRLRRELFHRRGQRRSDVAFFQEREHQLRQPESVMPGSYVPNNQRHLNSISLASEFSTAGASPTPAKDSTEWERWVEHARTYGSPAPSSTPNRSSVVGDDVEEICVVM
jgi:hypothetical protein